MKNICIFLTLVFVLPLTSLSFASDITKDNVISKETITQIVVANNGDVDGDGKWDVLIGVPDMADEGSETGRVYLFLTKNVSDNSFDLDKADYVFVGEEDHDRAGTTVAFATDLDSDNLHEVVIGFGSDKTPMTIYSSELDLYATNANETFEPDAETVVTPASTDSEVANFEPNVNVSETPATTADVATNATADTDTQKYGVTVGVGVSKDFDCALNSTPAVPANWGSLICFSLIILLLTGFKYKNRQKAFLRISHFD